MSKHTPGPWEVTKDNLGVCVGLNVFLHPEEPRRMTEEECEKEEIDPCDDYSIADCSGGILARPSEECEANARLIAAAPELLEACKEALKNCDGRTQPTLTRKLSQAIAKAEGK
jgi:hypothetical protein